MKQVKQIKQGLQKGFTLIELGIVLALIGMALFFAISKISETNDVSKAQNVANDLSTIITNTKRFYGAQAGGFPSDLMSDGNLIKFGAFPPSWVEPGSGTGSSATPTTIKAPFGGKFAMLADTNNSADAIITIPNVPQRVCLELGRAMANGVKNLKVKDTDVKTVSSPTLNLGTLASKCDGQSDMLFTFTR